MNILMQNPAFWAIFLLIWTNSISEYQLFFCRANLKFEFLGQQTVNSKVGAPNNKSACLLIFETNFAVHLSVLCSNHVNLLSQFDWKDLFLFSTSYSLHVSTVFCFLEGGGASPRNLCKLILLFLRVKF